MSSINSKIEEALRPVTENIWPLCCPYEQPPDFYIVYNPEIEETGLYGDNEDQEWIQNMQVHLYTKSDYTKPRRKIRKLLRQNKMTVTDIATLYEKETGYNHLCFSFQAEEDLEEE